MKRVGLLRDLRKHGCCLKREGTAHSFWSNPQTGVAEAVPHPTEIPNSLARKICLRLSVPPIGSQHRATGLQMNWTLSASHGDPSKTSIAPKLS